MSTFEFRHSDQIDGPIIARIEADNEREARAALRDMIHSRKLSAREIIELSQRGLAIIDAKTGQAIGGEPAEAEAEVAE
ncbi:MAG: hypothetical protein J0M00_13185 [Burkholderiales bacterium]|nr:hypothetical protein [Burkholderiales bacterium]